MSSHHFVREGQEPALLVIDALADDHLMAMLEWSPLVLVAASAIPKVASWGIRVDAIFIDRHAHNDSVAYDAIPHVGPVAIIDSSNGLVPSVLSFLRNRGQHALEVMTASPEENLRAWEDAGDFQVTLVDASMKWSRIPSGRFEKWIPEAAVLHVRGAAHFEVSGARQHENEITAEYSGMVRILSSASIWVGEQHR
ncbi:MAG TPA: hypothetical protein VK658_06245 [Chryseolinea sp.]|nr:hypothetical protein [Chryseolinea sp.]